VGEGGPAAHGCGLGKRSYISGRNVREVPLEMAVIAGRVPQTLERSAQICGDRGYLNSTPGRFGGGCCGEGPRRSQICLA
jgi:hypothetical protein